jgi:hypothetical protein
MKTLKASEKFLKSLKTFLPFSGSKNPHHLFYVEENADSFPFNAVILAQLI